MTRDELLEMAEPEYDGNLAEALHDVETVAKVRAGKICKAMNSAYVIWSREFYEREMERVRTVLGAVPGAGHPGGDPAGVQQGRAEPDSP